MPLVIAGHKPATFEIKSANLPLLSLLLKATDLGQLSDELAQRFGEIPDFFDNDPLVIDLSLLPVDAPAADFVQLLPLLRQYRLQPLAFKGGTEVQAQAALDAGLITAPDTVTALPAKPQDKVVAPAPVLAPPPAHALVIDKPLRSGQQVYARGRDLVITAMVNPGAEVIADGNIHVYAPLRGKAIAGARGNEEARIFTLSLQAQLLSINGIYRTSEQALPAELQGKPAQIRLDGEKLVMQPLNLDAPASRLKS